MPITSLQEQIQDTVITTLKIYMTKMISEIEIQVLEPFNKRISDLVDRCAVIEERMQTLTDAFVVNDETFQKLELQIKNKASCSKLTIQEENIHSLAEKIEETFQEFDIHVQNLIEERLRTHDYNSETIKEILESKIPEINKKIFFDEQMIEQCNLHLHALQETLHKEYESLEDLRQQCTSSFQEIKLIQSELENYKLMEIPFPDQDNMKVCKVTSYLYNSLVHFKEELETVKKKSDSSKILPQLERFQNHTMLEIRDIHKRISQIETKIINEKNDIKIDVANNLEDINKCIHKTIRNVNIEMKEKTAILETMRELRKNLNSERYKAGTRAVQSHFILMDISERLDCLIKTLYNRNQQ